MAELTRHQRNYRANREARAAYNRQWRQAHPEQVREIQRRADARRKSGSPQRRARKKPGERARRRMVKDLITDLKAQTLCVDCHLRWHPRVMEFHHVRGVKSFALAASAGYGWDRVREEIAKCDLLCSNCHRIRHLPPLELGEPS